VRVLQIDVNDDIKSRVVEVDAAVGEGMFHSPIRLEVAQGYVREVENPRATLHGLPWLGRDVFDGIRRCSAQQWVCFTTMRVLEGFKLINMVNIIRGGSCACNVAVATTWVIYE
jgi:hypothetical protein